MAEQNDRAEKEEVPSLSEQWEALKQWSWPWKWPPETGIVPSVLSPSPQGPACAPSANHLPPRCSAQACAMDLCHSLPLHVT